MHHYQRSEAASAPEPPGKQSTRLQRPAKDVQYSVFPVGERKGSMRSRHIVATLIILALAASLSMLGPRTASATTRHKSYIGTITAIASNSLTIHSKTHAAYYHFVIDSGTKFLRHQIAISRFVFKVGSYVTVSYSPGPPNIA
jgi:hypothetical protein